MSFIDQIIGAESGGKVTAKNPRSSALGPGQFIDSTWLNTVARHRPDIAQGRSRADLLALRTDPALSRDMTAALASDNQGILAKAGLPVTSGTTYLAHFAGPKGAVDILSAAPNRPVIDILGPAAVKANPFLQKMTAGELAVWADEKMGGQHRTVGASVPAAPVADAAARVERPAAVQQLPQQQPMAGAILNGVPAHKPPDPPNLDWLRSELTRLNGGFFNV